MRRGVGSVPIGGSDGAVSHWEHDNRICCSCCKCDIFL